MVRINTETKEETERETTIPDDYRQRISQFLEEEGERIREEADQELASIIAKAKEEYKKRVGRFFEGERIRKDADQQSAYIIAKAKEEYRKSVGLFLEEEGERIRR